MFAAAQGTEVICVIPWRRNKMHFRVFIGVPQKWTGGCLVKLETEIFMDTKFLKKGLYIPAKRKERSCPLCFFRNGATVVPANGVAKFLPRLPRNMAAQNQVNRAQ